MAVPNVPIRAQKVCTVKLDEKAVSVAERLIIGYAATWDVDSIEDRINPAAFDRTIQDRGPRMTAMGVRSKIKAGYNHGETIGIPVVMRADKTGLYTETRVTPTQCGDDVLAKVADGTVDEMSISYDILEYDYDGRIRDLNVLKLYEYGPVDFACNEAAAILGVKDMRGMLGLLKSDDVRSALRELQELKELVVPTQQLLEQVTRIQPLVADLKAGRVMSAANMGLLSQAIAALQALFAAAQTCDPDDAAAEAGGKSTTPPAPEKDTSTQPDEELDDETKSALEALCQCTRSTVEQLRKVA